MGQPKKFEVFSAEQLESLDAMLLDGVAASKVVDVIQNEWGLLTEDKHSSVKKMLERYRAKDLRERVVKRITEHATKSHVPGLTKKLNAVEELTQLSMIQKTRFEKALTMEAKSPMLLSSVSAEAKLYKEVLVELGKMQLETGVIQRAPKKLTGSIVDENGEVKSFEWTEEQEKLFRDIEAYEEEGVYKIG